MIEDQIKSKIKGILEFYGHKFMFGKKILDLGCGQADVSGVFRQLGADITAVDIKQENLIIATKKFPGLKTIRADLNQVYPFQNKNFDLILNLDLINYLQSYENHLKLICNSTEHLILEMCVVDSDDPYKNLIVKSNQQTMHYPSTKAIERVLNSCHMTFRRLDNNQFNNNNFKYDWISKNNNNFNLNNRRIWFCIKAHSSVQFSPKLESSNCNNLVNNKITLQGSTNIISNETVIKLKSNNIVHNLNPTIPNSRNKMKVALCISGHLRTFEENYYSVKNYIYNKLDCDVFIHTWDTIGHRHRGADSHLSHQLTNNLTTKINKLYNPKKLIIEKARHFPTSKIMMKRKIDNRDVVGVQSMYYKIEACNFLKKQYENQNNFKYDCVIRYRGDLEIKDTLPINLNQDYNYLYVPSTGHFGGLNDQIAFGSSEIMDKYSTLYSNINTYLEEGCSMNPEKLLEYHVNKLQLPIHRTDIKYIIVRANGTIQDNFILENKMGFK